MKNHFFLSLLFLLLSFNAIAQNQQDQAKQETPSESLQFQRIEILVNTGIGQYFDDLYVEDIGADFGVSEQMGYYYSLSGLYHVNKRFSMGLFYSELLKKKQTSTYYDDAEKEIYQTKVSNQYIAFIAKVNFYLNSKFKLSLGLSIGRTNFFYETGSTLRGSYVNGNKLSYGLHGNFNYSISKHWGISANFNSIFAQLDELNIQFPHHFSNINLKEDPLNIGKYEMGLGVVFSFP